MTSEDRWIGDFGTKYAQFFTMDPPVLDAHWLKTWAVKRSKVVERLMKEMPRDTSILEIGCGPGNQMKMLKDMGFIDITGLDINAWAIEEAKRRGLDASVGSAFALPYPPKTFGLVFTCGVLSHLEPGRVGKAISEICRVAEKWVSGTEYVNNTGNGEFIWPANYKERFTACDPGLKVCGKPQVLVSLGAGNLEAYLLKRRD